MKNKLNSLILPGIVRLLLKQFHVIGVLIMIATSTNLRAQKSIPNFTIDPHRIIITHQEQTLAISIDCPFFTIEKQIIGGYSPLGRYGDIRRSAKEPFRISYAPVNLQSGGQMDIQLLIQWSPKEKLLHKWVRFRLSDIEHPVLLKEIILDRLEVNDRSISLPTKPGQSYPVFLSGFFVGIEFPVSSVRMESGHIVLAHQPGYKMQPGKWYESRKAVYCVAQKGYEKEAFLSYIAANRKGKDEIHVNYNSWWTSPLPYSEKNILELMKTFKEKMFLPFGASLNTFCIDLGWSDPKSIWGIDTILFPKKFINIQQAAKKMNANVGLWISPSNMYSPLSLDSKWAEQQGYETFGVDTSNSSPSRFCCLGGERYSTAFRKQLVDMIKKYGIMQLKFDGYLYVCPKSNHGHEPGYLSMEPIAESLIETFRQIYKVSPKTWIETTCMGRNPSPWWLFNANSVIGNHGDDSPPGRIPCPVYRESYTSARDFYNIQGATYIMTPISAQEVLGIIHQTQEPFTNDAVTTIMRGHLFLPLYINPAFMDKSRWKMIAEIVNWAKKNSALIKNTKVLLPESWKDDNVPKFIEDAQMPREPYGYAHCSKKEGLIELRNPWIRNTGYILKIDSSTGFAKNITNLNIVSVYPEVRVYATDLQYGDSVNIPLAPYETLILSVSGQKSLNGLPKAINLLHGFGHVKINNIEKNIIRQPEFNNLANPDSTLHSPTSMVRFSMEGSVEVTSPQADLLVLIEGKNDTLQYEGTIYINGNSVQPLINRSSKGWTATSLKKQEHWVFLKAPLKNGENLISLKFDLPRSTQKISVWVWAKKPGKTSPESYPNTLPQPEDISLESVNLVESFTTESVYVR